MMVAVFLTWMVDTLEKSVLVKPLLKTSTRHDNDWYKAWISQQLEKMASCCYLSI